MLPKVPPKESEITQVVNNRQLNDELKTIAQLGSMSGSILIYLELTREIIAETIAQSNAGRTAQTNLADIRGRPDSGYTVGVAIITQIVLNDIAMRQTHSSICCSVTVWQIRCRMELAWRLSWLKWHM